jgi:outer membrane lipoprotein-sorting protein
MTAIRTAFLASNTLLLAAGTLLWAASASAQSAEDKGLAIAKKIDQHADGYKAESSVMEMVLINAHGDRTTRKLKQEQMEVSGDGDRSRIEFEWPADVKGTRMLTHTHKKGNDDQWLFLPAINRVKRISSGNKSGSFMGSEFAYEDLGSQEIEKYKHKLLGEEQLDGRKVWKLERIPVDKESGYTKLITYMDQEYLSPLKIEYFDRKGELLKTATFSGYKKFGKWFRPGSIVMLNHQTKKQSQLSWSDRKVSIDVREKSFESDELGS